MVGDAHVHDAPAIMGTGPPSRAATGAVATDSAPEAGAARRVIQAAVRRATEGHFGPNMTSETRTDIIHTERI
jgi:hypothetical protein